jgi:hypothetical protein
MEKCPQCIAIPEMLATVAATWKARISGFLEIVRHIS